MHHRELDRGKFLSWPLKDRVNRVLIERDVVPVDAEPCDLSAQVLDTIHETVVRIVQARKEGKSVILTFGAHAIKNGMGLVLCKLIELSLIHI